MLFSRASAVFLAAALSLAASAGPVDDEVKRFQTFFMTPGIAVAVVKDGKVVHAKGYGLANVEDQTKVRPDTVFRIASVSKQFIASAIMILEQDGKLSIEDKITKYFEGTPPEWNEITLRHLMNHTSGLQRETPGYEPFGSDPLLDQIKKSFTSKLVFPTGSKYQYCNLGYFMLAHVIEKASGQPWDAFMRARVFGPAGMQSTDVTNEDIVIPNRSRAYRHESGVLMNMPPYTAVRPSGAFVSTVLDMAKWDAALYGEKILTDASKAKMWAPTRLTSGEVSDYGFGWSIATENGHKVVAHDGGLVGFSTNITRYFDDKLTVITFANELETPASVLSSFVARHYIPGLAPVPPKETRDTEPEKSTLVAKYLRSRLGEKPDTTIMTEEFQKRVNWATGRARFRGFGELVSLTPLESKGLTEPYTHRYRARFKKVTLVATAAFKGTKLELVGVGLE